MKDENTLKVEPWEELFAPHILERGYNYYLEERVGNIVWKENNINALVSGTDEYHVIIQLTEDNSVIKYLNCDCPYAMDGNNCKHEAAVLYRLSEEATVLGGNSELRMDGLIEELSKQQTELRKIIDSIPEDEIKGMLYDLAKQNDVLQNRIILTYGESIDARQIKKLKDTILNIKYKYSDRHGFVNWENAYGYISALSDFLYDIVQPLIDRNFLEPAFELTCQVFITIGNTDIDDDGDVAMGAEYCCTFWERIADKASDGFQKIMYRWFKNHIGSDLIIDYMEGYLEDFLLTGFHSDELLWIRLKELDALIRRGEERFREHPERYWRPYWLEGHVLNRIQTMKELEMPQEEILEYYRKYDYLPKVLLEHAGEYSSSDNMQKSIELLVSGKKRDSENKVAVSEYSKRLIEIYRDLGAQKKLVAELLFQITTCQQSGLHYVNELKAAVGIEAWTAFRKQILNSDTCMGIRADLFEAEEMLPELLQEVIKSESIYMLEKYEKTLRPKFSDQIRDIYANHVKKEANRVSNRKQYRYLIKDLKKITRYDGGEEIAEEIANQWKAVHSRRPAFMDELRKAGF